MNKFALADDFPAVDYDAWRALVESELKGAKFEQKLVTRTYEGIDLQPVYTRQDEPPGGYDLGLPGVPPFVRGSTPWGAAKTGWDLRQEYAHPELQAANQAIRDDIAGGVTSVCLKLDLASRSGLDPDSPAAGDLVGRDGLAAYSLDDLDAALAGIPLDRVGVALEPGAAFLPGAAILAALWQRRGVAADNARGWFNADPIGALAREGELPYTPERAFELLGALAAWTAEHYPHVSSVCVDTSVYHLAGATAVQDLAFGLATAVEYLRALVDAGLSINTAARQIVFDLSLGTHHFLAISKLRAARRLWYRVVEASGGSAEAAAMRIHARTSPRVLTQRDPYVNLLRNTVAVFAAGVGGAESIESAPFDVLVGQPDEFSRRIARNTVLILQEESHLHRVVDPGGGSWFLERYTDQVAEAAWKLFQEVERQGGMLQTVRSGWVAEQIDGVFAQRVKDIARRKEGITGVSEFPNVAEEKISHPGPDLAAVRAAAVARRSNAGRGVRPTIVAQSPVDDVVSAAGNGASIGELARGLGFGAQSAHAPPLALRRFAEPYERLRDASDAWAARRGHRTRVFLASMGPPSHYIARATFSKNFFEAGGFEVASGDGFTDAASAADSAAAAFAASGAAIAVICSSDKLYPDIVPSLAGKLKAAGARTVVLAGNPGANEAAWRAAGVDRFIFIRCDVLATLEELLREEGVLE